MIADRFFGDVSSARLLKILLIKLMSQILVKTRLQQIYQLAKIIALIGGSVSLLDIGKIFFSCPTYPKDGTRFPHVTFALQTLGGQSQQLSLTMVERAAEESQMKSSIFVVNTHQYTTDPARFNCVVSLRT